MKHVQIWTDGGICNSKAIGSWAFCVYSPDLDQYISRSGLVENATSQVAELTAAINALEFCLQFKVDKYQFDVYSDSQYLVKGLNEWVKGWKSRNWRKSDGETIANKSLWQKLFELKHSFTYVSFNWVRGHAGIELNEHVDSLCQQELEVVRNDTRTGQSGS